MVDSVIEMFEIPDNIWIILPKNGILPSRPLMEKLLFFWISYLLGLDFHSH